MRRNCRGWRKSACGPKCAVPRRKWRRCSPMTLSNAAGLAAGMGRRTGSQPQHNQVRGGCLFWSLPRKPWHPPSRSSPIGACCTTAMAVQGMRCAVPSGGAQSKGSGWCFTKAHQRLQRLELLPSTPRMARCVGPRRPARLASCRCAPAPARWAAEECNRAVGTACRPPRRWQGSGVTRCGGVVRQVILGAAEGKGCQGAIRCQFRPNKGLELTASSVRSCLAPASGSSSGLALGVSSRQRTLSTHFG